MQMKSILDQFLGQNTDQNTQGGGSNNGALAKGALAGGLVGLLIGGGSPKKMIKRAVTVGGAAAIGGLAYKAYSDWQAGKAPEAAAGPTSVPTLPRAEGTVFMPADEASAEDLALRLVRAMVAAAKADGHVTSAERRRILSQLPQLGLGAEADTLIAEELEGPLDVGRVADLANSPEEAAEIYAASLLVVDHEAPAERGYLAMLAARLNLDPRLVEHLHANAEAMVEL